MRKLYIETKLFNVNDRLTSLNLCELINSWIDMGLLQEMEYCFLPYRDSNNEVGEVEDIGRAIFELDVATMRSCGGVTGYIDGPEQDAGCGFEIGFAYALGYPINLVTTDYFKCSAGDSSNTYVVSKLLQYIAKVVHAPDPNQNITNYREQCEELLNRAMTALRLNLIEDFGTVKEPKPAMQPQEVVYDFYLDPNFKYTESGRNLMESIITAIENAGKSYVIGDNQGDIAVDIDNLTKSGRGIFFADPFDPNLDTSILQGIAYGIGRDPILYSSSQQWYETSTMSYKRNVMVYYSAYAVVSSLTELVSLISS
jgi:nucleoside 2-deoxyribosyltransferase